MRPPLAVTVWRVSLTWGVLSLTAGAVATIYLAASGSVFSLSAWLALVFALPIGAVYAARRSPILAGLGLLVVFALVRGGAVADAGFGNVPAMLRQDYVWLHVLFGTVFLILHTRIRQAFPAPTNYSDEPAWNEAQGKKVESWMAYRPPKMHR